MCYTTFKYEQMFGFLQKKWQSGLDKSEIRGIMVALSGAEVVGLPRFARNDKHCESQAERNDRAQGANSSKMIKRQERQVSKLDSYVKAILYTYPKMQKMKEDYEVHIRNKAYFSYTGSTATDKLCEYIAGQILELRTLERLKAIVDGIWQKLTETERFLAELKYFGKSKKTTAEAIAERGKEFLKKKFEGLKSERNYFRRQERLLKKIGAFLRGAGITEEVFLSEFACIAVLRLAYRFVKAGKEKRVNKKEKQFILRDRRADGGETVTESPQVKELTGKEE
ncbi:MAG: hypothetical protein IJ506_08170 [Clostridia bacterium]|nr:hypothetical protein [Clostridia bacterium]